MAYCREVQTLQDANTVHAGPLTGSPADPIFRALVSNDIPVLDTSKITTGTLPVARGGTNSATALSSNRIMVSSTGAIVEAAAMTNGQILIGSTGAAPVVAALTQGAGISITNAAGSITIAASVTTPSRLVYFGITGNVAADTYAPPGSGSGSASDNLRVPLPMAGTVKNLFVRLSSAPGSGKTLTATVFKNGAATTLTCDITGTAVANSDTTHTFTVVAGDTISLHITTTSGASPKDLVATVEMI